MIKTTRWGARWSLPGIFYKHKHRFYIGTVIMAVGLVVHTPANATVNLCVEQQRVTGNGVNDLGNHILRFTGDGVGYKMFWACGAKNGTFNSDYSGTNYSPNVVSTISTPGASGPYGCYARVVWPVVSKWIQIQQYSTLAECESRTAGCINHTGYAMYGYNGWKQIENAIGVASNYISLSY